MSEAFMNGTDAPKLLVVAGMDRLDKDMTIAQMRGQLQLKIAYGCGHTIQEDDPLKFAGYLAEVRFRDTVWVWVWVWVGGCFL